LASPLSALREIAGVFRDPAKDLKERVKPIGPGPVQAQAIDQLHDQVELLHLNEFSDTMQVVSPPQVAMVELAANRKLRLHLLQETVVVGHRAYHVLDRNMLPRFQLDGHTDLRSCTNADLSGDSVSGKRVVHGVNPASIGRPVLPVSVIKAIPFLREPRMSNQAQEVKVAHSG